MARSIVGLFADRTAAERAIVDLKSAGFDPTQMGIVMHDRAKARQTAEDEAASSAAGAATGGPVGLGVPQEEARYYQSRVESGSVLLTVAAPYRAQEVWEIMRRNGAEDLRAKGFGGASGQEIGRVYAQSPQDAGDGTVAPPANREDSEDSYEPEGNAVSSLTGAQHHYRPEPLPEHQEEDDQTAHQPPVRENDVVIGGWDAPDHPTTDADILRERGGRSGQLERPEQ